MKLGVPYEIRYEAKNGRAIYQGDVDLGPVEQMDRMYRLFESRKVQFAQVAIDTRWPGAVVSYVVDDSVPAGQKGDIKIAIGDWQKATVLRFVELTKPKNEAYIVFTAENDSDAPPCLSTAIGRSGSPTSRIQFIRLKLKCSRGSIRHEIGHAVGLFHEHTRCDRDRYININWANVERPDQFYRECALAWWKDLYRPDAYASGPYDYSSVMHYERYAFAKDPRLPTIIAPKPIGLEHLSAGDIEAINTLYVNWSANRKIPGLKSTRTPTLIRAWDRLHMLSVDSDGYISHSALEGAKWVKRGRITNKNGMRFHASTASLNAAFHADKLYVAFSGSYKTPSIVARTQDTGTWDEAAGVVERNQNNSPIPVWTASAPAIASFNGRLWIVYRKGDSADLYYTFLDSSGRFSRPIQLPTQKTRHAPALATFDGALHLVHRGKEQARLYHSKFDGKLWSKNERISGQYSLTSVALASFDNRLHMVHSSGDTTTSKNLYYTFLGPDGSWRPDTRIAGKKSKAAATLSAIGNCLHLVHLGETSDDLWQSTLFSLNSPNAAVRCQ